MPTPGHAPGHTSFTIASGADHIIHQVDVTAGMGTLFVQNPGWHFLFDVDGQLAEQTRRKFYEMAAADQVRIQGFHFPFTAVGNIEKNSNGYHWVPTA